MALPQRLMRRLRNRGISPGQQDAFTLVELLVGGVLTVVVVSSLAAIALIAELRMGRDAEVNQVLRDNWSRTIAFISNEAEQAHWIRTPTDPSAYTCPTSRTRLAGSPLLVLEGPPTGVGANNTAIPAWRVVYAVMTNNEPAEWRGFNLLVRCGPPYEAIARSGSTEEDSSRAAVGGNLAYCLQYQPGSATCASAAAPQESVITDQLAQTDPFRVRVFETNPAKGDREALLSLNLSRRSNPNLTYPPLNSSPGNAAIGSTAFTPGFQTQIRTARNPAFDLSNANSCLTSADAAGNQEPPNPTQPPCLVASQSGQRTLRIKEYRLPNGTDLQVNKCTLGPDCEGPKSTGRMDVIYLKGNFRDFTTNQFSPTSTLPCSRSRCYLSSGSQSVTIYDGDVLVFFDRIVRL